jgi:hypothetical protein
MKCFIENLKGDIMRKLFLSAAIFLLLFLINGCTEECPKEEVVAQVNSYYMSIDDFKEDLKALSLYRPRSIDSYEGRANALNDIIEKEILLQEAQELGLDKDEAFRRTIENYWKQTLLIMLIEKKAKEISDRVHVYDDEVDAYYKALKERNPDIDPLPEVKGELKRIIRSDKETAMMQEWIEELKSKAYIKINEDVLKQIKMD